MKLSSYIIIACVALVLRLTLLMSYHNTQQAEQQDALDYQAIGQNLAQGIGFIGSDGQPTSSRPPLYPLFLAASYKVFGYRDMPVKAIQCLIDSCTVVLIMMIALLLSDARAAFIAGLLAACYPPTILYSNLRLTECLFTFLMIAEIYFMIRAFKENRGKHLLLAGIMHGIATMVRSTLLVLPMFLLPLLLINRWRKPLLKYGVLWFLIGSAIIAPWTIRNYMVFHKFIPVNVAGGHLLWFAIQPDAYNGDTVVELSPIREFPELANMPRSQWDGLMTRRMMKYAISHPIAYISAIAPNAIRFWSLPVGKVLLAKRSRSLATALQAIHLLFVICSFWGLAILLRKSSDAVPIALLFVYATIMHSITLPAPRYRLPYEPLMLLCASYLLARISLHWGSANG